MIRPFSILFLTLLMLGSSFSIAEVRKTEVAPTPMMTAEARLLVSLLEQAHFAGTPINQIDLHDLLPNFMSDMDYNRLFFTQADHDNIMAKYAGNLESDLRRGHIQPAFDIFKIYRERALSRIDWILKRLESDFDFETDQELVLDRRKLSWPANREEADQLWDKRLTYELLVDLLNDKPLEEAKGNVTRRYERLQRSLMEMESDEVQEIFLTALSKLYDPHSSFLSASTLEDFSISMRLSLVGIGALLRSEDGYCTIQELIPGGPAALDNQLRPNDRVVAVAQDGGEPVDVIDMKLRRVVEMIRGKKGTRVELTIIPADATDSSVRRTITLVRDEIRLTASRAQAKIYEVPNSEGEILPIGVITIPSFYGSVGSAEGQTKTSTTDDVEELIKQLKSAGINGLVLDLRRNGGGLLSEAIRLTGLFIETGPVVRVKSSDGRLRVDPDQNPNVAYSGPLAVLVSRNSASASEIVAGALQNYDRALILGESSTHGKGTVQAIFELENYLFRMGGTPPRTGAAKMTVQKFYLPDGQSTQNRGVVPDIIFPSFNEFLSIGESDLPNALVWDTIEADGWKAERERFPIRSQLQQDLVERLSKRSAERQAETEEFQYLNRNIEFFREKQEQKAISLNLQQRREQKERDTQFREEMKAAEEALAAHAYDSRKFLLVEEPEAQEEQPGPEETEGEESLEMGLARADSGIDIHLRESLRIVTDLVGLGSSIWAEGAVTAQTAGN
jgi:carboxyl-terminal processing protease